MKRLSNNSGIAASTEYHVVKRILAGLLAASCMLGASAATTSNALPSVSLTTPVANASYVAPASMSMTAVASDTDGTIASVTYYRDSTWLGSSAVAPYVVNWGNIAAGTYSMTARATDNLGGVTISAPVSVTVRANALPTVAIVSPLNNASFTAPGTIVLKASAADADGTINRVAYYNGAAYLGASSTSPYSFSWTNVAAGNYSITAKAYDNYNAVKTSAPIAVTVAAQAAATQIFYVYTDQINTAREITNAAGVKVWQADLEPFGANLPNENPAGQGVFTYNPRFPGQYFDRETGLHYNYHRDYDPQTGRYIQSDPIGLGGGLNTYAYANGQPLQRTDSLGLWSKGAHDRIFREALAKCKDSSGKAPPISDYQDYSDKFDRATGLGTTYANAHYMSKWFQSSDSARRGANDFISMNTNSAARDNSSHLNIPTNRDITFSMAAHTLQDSTSPAHTNDAGDLLAWPTPWNVGLHGDSPFSSEDDDALQNSQNSVRFAEAVRLTQELWLRMNNGKCGCN